MGYLSRYRLIRGLFLFVLVSAAACSPLPKRGERAAEPVLLQASRPERPVWIDNCPPDEEDGRHFLAGLSEYHASERAAREDAMRHAREQFARYTGVEVALVDEVVRTLHGPASEILDAGVEGHSSSTENVDALVSRIKAREWYWEKYRVASGEPAGTAWRYWVLVSVPADEYDRVQAWKRQREEAQEKARSEKAERLREGLEAMAARRESPDAEPETIAVAPVKVQPAVAAMARDAGRDTALEAVVQSLSGRLTAKLHSSRAFQVVDASKTSPRFELLAEVEGFEDSTERIEYPRIGRTSLVRRVFLSSVVRVVDTETGALVAEAPAVRLSRTNTREGGDAPGEDEILVELAGEMAGKLVEKAVGRLRPARVLAVTGEQLLIDRGTEDGFRTGAVVELYAAETVRSPESGAPYRNEWAVGRGRIVSAEARQSFALCEGFEAGTAEGLIARVIEPAEEPLPQTAPAEKENDRWMTPGSSDKPFHW